MNEKQLEKINKDYGMIFNIQRFSIHDGGGIRTLVFMKGCLLKCSWCCNPESQSFSEDLLFVQTNCIGCGRCVEVCPHNNIDPVTFMIDRENCKVCGLCADACYSNAKKIVGRLIKRQDLLKEIEKDRLIYINSGGGVTMSGGEPTAQPDFVREFLKDCKNLNIHTAIETCGYGEWENIKGIFDYLDQVFFDLKCMNSERHRELTGVYNELILNNAKNIAALGKDITFRIPLIPGCTDSEENVREIAKFVSKLGNNVRIEVLPYHRLGEDKFRWMDKEYKLSGTELQPEDIKEKMNAIVKEQGCNVVE